MYPLHLLGALPGKGHALRLVTALQLSCSIIGTIVMALFTAFQWYFALTGLYAVDTFSDDPVQKECIDKYRK